MTEPRTAALNLDVDRLEKAIRTAMAEYFDLAVAEAYEQGHQDRYQRDRETDMRCVNCGQPWAVKAAAEPVCGICGESKGLCPDCHGPKPR